MFFFFYRVMLSTPRSNENIQHWLSNSENISKSLDTGECNNIVAIKFKEKFLK